MEIINLNKAIIEVMKEVNNIGKNTVVGNGKNAYKAVSDKDVREAIRQGMIKNWLTITPLEVQWDIKIDRWEELDTYSKIEWVTKTKQSIFTAVTTKYELSHTSWESKIIAWYWQGTDTQDKWAWKATTYALKNTLINLFLVPTGDDTDNTHSDDLPVPQRTTAPTAKWSIVDWKCSKCWATALTSKAWNEYCKCWY